MRNRTRTFVLLSVLLLFGSGCASLQAASHKSSQARSKQENKLRRLEKKLRLARNRIETLRERNQVLKIKVHRLESGELNEPASLDAFVETVDRPSRDLIDAKVPNRQKAALKAAAVPAGVIDLRAQPSERADRVLARTILNQIKAGDLVEAERTLSLLAKSYPESNLVGWSKRRLRAAKASQVSSPPRERRTARME